MEHAQSNQGPSFAVRVIKLPFQGLWFLIKHPILAIIMALLIAFSSVSFLAHFNPAIAERFNSAMGYFLGATLLSEASDALRRVRVKADKSKIKIADIEVDLERKKATIARKNKALLKASDDLYRSTDEIRKRGAELDLNKRKLKKFGASGKAIEKKATRRFTKVALYDAAGEFLGWIPVLGDAASIGMTAGGIYEMCQMFKEIEVATTELGVRYQVYTDTFCEKPIDKTKEVIAEKVGVIRDRFDAMTTVLQDYTPGIPVPDKQGLIITVRSGLDEAYELARKPYSILRGN